MICCSTSQKNTVHEVLDVVKNFFGSISPKTTQRTENGTVGRYRFGWNFDSDEKNFSSHARKWARLWFESYKKIKIKKKRKLLIMMIPDFSYNNSYQCFKHYHRHHYYCHYYFITAHLFLIGRRSKLFFNISKQNCINILFHREDCQKSKIMRKQFARSHFVYCISYFQWNRLMKNSL